MGNQPKFNNNKKVIAFLAYRFPLCFTAEGEARPLKIGIFQDLIERVQGKENISKTQLRFALRFYTSSWRYLYGIKLGAQRVDLEGNLCGNLKIQHIEYARKQLKEAKARVQRTAQQAKKYKSSKTVPLRRPDAAKQPSKADAVLPSNKPRFKQARHISIPIQTATIVNTMTITDISTLQIGQNIKVKIGKNPMNAIVIEIAKEGVRVQLSSGIALIVRAEHLQF